MAKAKGKRILSVTIRHIIDPDGDTSWLGEYSNRKSSDLFSIDRAHALDCNINSLVAKQGVNTFEHAIDYLNRSGEELVGEAFDEALTLLGDAQEELQDCSCDGGDQQRNEYQYFNPSFNYVDKLGYALKDYHHEGGDEEIRGYVAQDYERMERLNYGSWTFVGVRAVADVVVDGVSQDISSGGLWGIESDAGDYFDEVEAEQLSELKDQLKALGFGKRAISQAFKSVEHKEEY